MPASILSAAPPHLAYLSHSAVMDGLGRVLEEFMDKGLLTASVATELVKISAQKLDDAFYEDPAVSSTVLNFDYGNGIANYRLDEGHWELVVEGPLEASVIDESGDQPPLVFATDLLGIDGFGPGLKKTRKRKVCDEVVESPDLDSRAT